MSGVCLSCMSLRLSLCLSLGLRLCLSLMLLLLSKLSLCCLCALLAESLGLLLLLSAWSGRSVYAAAQIQPGIRIR